MYPVPKGWGGRLRESLEISVFTVWLTSNVVDWQHSDADSDPLFCLFSDPDPAHAQKLANLIIDKV
jgi:hypothetical protein